MEFSICLGDYSGDGHDKTENFIISVPDEFTEDAIAQSYAKNVAAFGFSPADIANGYEEWTLDFDRGMILINNGFMPILDNFVPVKGSEFFKMEYGIDGLYSDTDLDYPWDNNPTAGDCFTVNQGIMVQIIMFFISHGLENFSWKVVKPPKVLFGGGSVEKGGIGYGLYL